MAIFNFPIKNERHAGAAIMAAVEIQRRCHAALADVVSRRGVSPTDALGVGVGVHTGQVEIGEFSTFRSDFTAIGGVVNLTTRLESQAAVGEILVSVDAAAQAPELMAGGLTRSFVLKGIERPVSAYVLSTSC